MACTAAALMLAAAAASASFPGANGKIAFGTVNPTDVYVVNPDGTGLTNLTNSTAQESYPAWSPDGTKIAFVRDCQLAVMNGDGTGANVITNPNVPGWCRTHPAWSPTGTEIVFGAGYASGGSDLHIIGADGTGERELVADSGDEDQPEWSPDGSRIVYWSQYDLFTILPDGSGKTNISQTSQQESLPHWSADGGRLSFNRGGFQEDLGIYTSKPDGSDVRHLPGTADYADAVWSPEGGEFAVSKSATQIAIVNENGLQPRPISSPSQSYYLDWQPVPPAPVPPGYPRPRGATPLRVSLVPAFDECAAPNSSHGGPLAFPSCAAPVQSSPYLTLGNSETNGLPTRSLGSVRYAVTIGDVEVTASITDVRCRTTDVLTCAGGALSDYTGELEATSKIRVTDRANSHTATIPGTMDHFQFPVRIPCTATASADGSTCQVATTFNTVLPGAVVDGKRAIWELAQVQVRDGGQDGSANSDDYASFLVQGLLVP
jgi:Tol biopolymer transport system component